MNQMLEFAAAALVAFMCTFGILGACALWPTQAVRVWVWMLIVGLTTTFGLLVLGML